MVWVYANTHTHTARGVHARSQLQDCEDISHGLWIGKDQKGDNQRNENGYQFNNIGFIDDISIFANTPEGMQKLLNVVQEFTAWYGMQINVKKTYLLAIDNDK